MDLHLIVLLCWLTPSPPTPCCRANWTHWMWPLQSEPWTWTETYSPRQTDLAFFTTSWLVGSSRILIYILRSLARSVCRDLSSECSGLGIVKGTESKSVNGLILRFRSSSHISRVFFPEQNHCRAACSAANQQGLVSEVHTHHQGK